jgi:ribosomal protein S2
MTDAISSTNQKDDPILQVTAEIKRESDQLKSEAKSMRNSNYSGRWKPYNIMNSKELHISHCQKIHKIGDF